MRWVARDASGAEIAAAPVVVLANACDAARLADLGGDPLRRIRGQQSYLPAPPFAAPRVVVGGDGYVLPAVDGIAVAGATYDLDNDDPYPDAASHAVNLARAERMLPGSAAGVDAATLAGGVGFRCVATDRLPMVGAIVDVDRARVDQPELAGAHLADLPRVHGLYGAFAFASRGLSWSALAAEALASELDGEPAPLSRALLDAIDPGRFIAQGAAARHAIARSRSAIHIRHRTRKTSCPPRSPPCSSRMRATSADCWSSACCRRTRSRWSGRSFFSITSGRCNFRRDEASTCGRIRTSGSPP